VTDEPISPPLDSAVLTRALLHAADRLGISKFGLSEVLGVSQGAVARMKSGAWRLQAGTMPFELGGQFVRLFRSLDALTGGDESAARTWLAKHNSALGGRPIILIRTRAGLADAWLE
jgi:hypothetical protein